MYARGRIIVSKKSEEKAKQLRNDSDTVEAFLDECCTITHQDSDRVDRKDLYGDYCSWCEEWERQSHQKNGFFKALRNKRFKEIKSHGNWYFCGLKYGKEEPVDENGYIQFSVDNENPFDFN
jgi:phage/plasmid-associated DNA primase